MPLIAQIYMCPQPRCHPQKLPIFTTKGASRGRYWGFENLCSNIRVSLSQTPILKTSNFCYRERIQGVGSGGSNPFPSVLKHTCALIPEANFKNICFLRPGIYPGVGSGGWNPCLSVLKYSCAQSQKGISNISNFCHQGWIQGVSSGSSNSCP